MGTVAKILDIQRQLVAMKAQIDTVDSVNKKQADTLARSLRVIKIMQDALQEFSLHTEAAIKERAQVALFEALKASMPEHDHPKPQQQQEQQA